MIDALLGAHLLTQLARVAAALVLFAVMHALGATLLRRVEVADATERLLLRVAVGFAAFQWVVRVAGELSLLLATVALAVWSAAAAAAAFRNGARRQLRLPHSTDWRVIAIIILLLAPLTMALAPAVSRDALIYHLRFPELTLRGGAWAYDLANSASFYPAATSTLYVAALAVDAQGVVAQLVHLGFFVLTIVAVAAIARRLGARSGRDAALLFAALPAAGVVAGWAWADHSLLFALAASALALLAGAPVIALALLGLAAATKYTAILAGLPLGIAVIVQLVRARAFRKLIAGLALAVLVASPWYVTNALRTGNPIHPLGDPAQRRTSMQVNWARDDAQSRMEVWSGYFTRPQTLDEDVGGLLFLGIAAIGLVLAARDRRLRPAVLIAVAMWLGFAPFTPAMRLLLPAVAATLIVAGAAFERSAGVPAGWRGGVSPPSTGAAARDAADPAGETPALRWLPAALIALFALRGGAIVAAHNAHFLNPMPAAAGIEPEQMYIARNFPPAPLFARAARLPANARVVAINEVRLFRFPRPVSASRNLDAPLIRRYVGGAKSLAEVVARLRGDGVTHLLIGTHPVERGTPAPLTPDEQRLVTELVRAGRVIDREGDTLLLALPR